MFCDYIIRKRIRISPPLGLGDLLTLKILEEEKDNDITIDTICINCQILKAVKIHPEIYTEFIIWFCKILFPYTKIVVTEGTIIERLINSNLIVKTTKLLSYFDTLPCKFEKPYLVFHTKFRQSLKDINFFIENYLDKLNYFLENYECKYTIVIVGEREIEQNKESICHNIQSLYSSLLLLTKKNFVIDLTYKELYSGNDKKLFLNDLSIMRHAKNNIVFGIGGNFCLCKFLCENMICYTVSYEYISEKLLCDKDNDYIISDFDLFCERLNMFKTYI